MSEGRGTGAFLAVAALFALADQGIKQLVDATFALGEVRVVIPDFFSLTYLRNPGGAFSILGDLPPGWGRAFFVCATLAALAFVFYLHRRHAPESLWGKAGLLLVFGGGLGNLVDRLAYGEVIDYLLFYYGAYYWPAFNLADTGITTGVCLLAFDVFTRPPEEDE